MNLLLAVLGILLSIILIYYNARENKSTIYLGVFFIIASITSLHRYVINSSGSATLVSIFLVNFTFVYYLAGPFLYLYIRSILTDDPGLKRRDLWHLMPLVVFLIICSPYLFTSWTFKKDVAEHFVRVDTNQALFMAEIFGSRLWFHAYFITPLLVLLGYVLRSSVMLFDYLKQKEERKVFIRQQYALTWIKAFIGIMFMLTLSYLFLFIYTMVFENTHFYTLYKKLDPILAVGPVVILILTFFSPGILYGLPRLPGKRIETSIPPETQEPVSPVEKTTQLQLESGYLQTIGREADACMEKFQPYTNPSFNLAEFSVLIRIPVHHLSYYFREEKKQSFTDYRNEWRVKHARKLILEGRTGEMTLEAIGMLSGFPNRDAFRTAFQRVEGVTPAVFMTKKLE